MINKEQAAFLEANGIPCVFGDEVGYHRAEQFYEHVGLPQLKGRPILIYDGKVFVKPENKDVVRQRLGEDSQEV